MRGRGADSAAGAGHECGLGFQVEQTFQFHRRYHALRVSREYQGGVMEQRRVVITGAGSGLGRALAFAFAEHGWRVACADIRLDKAQETVRLITEFGVGAMALNVDVGNDASVEEMRDEI